MGRYNTMRVNQRIAVFSTGLLLLIFPMYMRGSLPPEADQPQTESNFFDILRPDEFSLLKQSRKFRSIPNKAFTVGEKFTFDIDWGFSTVGSASLAIPRIIKYNGFNVYEVRSRAQSNNLISKIYKVDDQVISYIDSTGIFSVRIEKKLSEGNYRQNREFILDHIKQLAYSKRDTVKIPEYCQDILSAFYYVRTQNLKIGTVLEVPNYDNGKIYNIIVEVQKKQQVRVPAGKFNCIVIEPTLKSEGLFKHQGTIKIYLTDDERKIPVLMVSNVVFGEISARLVKIEKEIYP